MNNKRVNELRKEQVEKKLKQLIIDMMNIVGLLFLAAFSMIGAITFYAHPRVIIDVPITSILTATVVVIFLFLMSQVKKW